MQTDLSVTIVMFFDLTPHKFNTIFISETTDCIWIKQLFTHTLIDLWNKLHEMIKLCTYIMKYEIKLWNVETWIYKLSCNMLMIIDAIYWKKNMLISFTISLYLSYILDWFFFIFIVWDYNVIWNTQKSKCRNSVSPIFSHNSI